MKKESKVKYDPEYISYVEKGESAAVFIVRDIVKSIDTEGKWIDVIDSDGFQRDVGDEWRADYRWDFKWIEVELFPRKTRPVYPKDADKDEIKYITWQTANEDIAALRRKGYHGEKFRICPKLVNEKKGKTKVVEKVWNKTFERYVPRKWMTSSCEVRKVRVQVKPEWTYHIISVKRL